MCLLASWVKRYLVDDNKLWKKQRVSSMTLIIQTCLRALIETPLNSGRGFYGQLKLPKWGIGG
uniref:Uncharacterized protein n=1 Tax=Arundo donax TaxID=35708 RepID=A0A0A9AL89_ARUDO